MKVSLTIKLVDPCKIDELRSVLEDEIVRHRVDDDASTTESAVRFAADWGFRLDWGRSFTGAYIAWGIAESEMMLRGDRLGANGSMPRGCSINPLNYRSSVCATAFDLVDALFAVCMQILDPKCEVFYDESALRRHYSNDVIQQIRLMPIPLGLNRAELFPDGASKVPADPQSRNRAMIETLAVAQASAEELAQFADGTIEEIRTASTILRQRISSFGSMIHDVEEHYRKIDGRLSNLCSFSTQTAPEGGQNNQTFSAQVSAQFSDFKKSVKPALDRMANASQVAASLPQQIQLIENDTPKGTERP